MDRWLCTLEESFQRNNVLAAGGDFEEGARESGKGAKGASRRGEGGGERCLEV